MGPARLQVNEPPARVPGRSRALAGAVLVALAAHAGCSGQTGGDEDRPSRPEPTGAGLDRLSRDDASRCEKQTKPGDPGEGVARRLNRREYDNTIADLLFDGSRPARDFPADERALNFDTNSSVLTVSLTHAEAYSRTAKRLAESAVKQRFGELVPCDPVGKEAECGKRFIDEFGRRAFRRPLDADERDILTRVFEQGRKTSFENAVQLVIEVAVQSAPFLYRFERLPQDGDGIERVDSWDMASRLSYLLWATMPDDELFAAAAADELREPADIERQVRRMLKDGRSINFIGPFVEQWLGLNDEEKLGKDAEIYTDWRSERFALMREEVRRFADDLVYGGGDFHELMTAQHSLLNPELAAHYGVEHPGGDDFARVDFPEGERAGLVTMGAIMAAAAKPNQASPVLRGKFIREHIMCQGLPSPPPDVDATPPDLDPNLTTRERFARRTESPACGNCHQLIDPVGFGLSHYDGVGRYMEEENGLPIDASGEIIGLDAEGPFDGAAELSTRLAGSAEVQRCFVSNWFRFAFGRVETDADACSLHRLDRVFSSPDSSLKDLILALTDLDNFRYRRLEAAQ